MCIRVGSAAGSWLPRASTRFCHWGSCVYVNITPNTLMPETQVSATANLPTRVRYTMHSWQETSGRNHLYVVLDAPSQSTVRVGRMSARMGGGMQRWERGLRRFHHHVFVLLVSDFGMLCVLSGPARGGLVQSNPAGRDEKWPSRATVRQSVVYAVMSGPIPCAGCSGTALSIVLWPKG
jgi:hypothetical protein